MNIIRDPMTRTSLALRATVAFAALGGCAVHITHASVRAKQP